MPGDRAHAGAYTGAGDIEALRRQLREQIRVDVGDRGRGYESGGGVGDGYGDELLRRYGYDTGRGRDSRPSSRPPSRAQSLRGSPARDAGSRQLRSHSQRSSPVRSNYGRDYEAYERSSARGRPRSGSSTSLYGRGGTASASTSLRGSPAGSLSGRPSRAAALRSPGRRRNSPPPPPRRFNASRELFAESGVGRAGRSARGPTPSSSRPASSRQGRSKLPGYMQPRGQSRSVSRAGTRATSRAGSQAASRANSRPTSRPTSRAGSRAPSRSTSRVGSRSSSRAHSPEPAFRSLYDTPAHRNRSISPSHRGDRCRGYSASHERPPLRESSSFTLGTLRDVRATLEAGRSTRAKGSARRPSASARGLSGGAASHPKKRSQSARGPVPSYMRPLERGAPSRRSSRALASERSAPLLPSWSAAHTRRSRSVLDRTPSPPRRPPLSERGRQTASIYAQPVLASRRGKAASSSRTRAAAAPELRPRAASARGGPRRSFDEREEGRVGRRRASAHESQLGSFVDSLLSGGSAHPYAGDDFGQTRGREGDRGRSTGRASVRLPSNSARAPLSFGGAAFAGARAPVSAAAIAAAAQSSRARRYDAGYSNGYPAAPQTFEHVSGEPQSPMYFDHSTYGAPSSSPSSHRGVVPPSAYERHGHQPNYHTPPYQPPASGGSYSASSDSYAVPHDVTRSAIHRGRAWYAPPPGYASAPASPTYNPSSHGYQHAPSPARSVDSTHSAGHVDVLSSAREHAAAYARASVYAPRHSPSKVAAVQPPPPQGTYRTGVVSAAPLASMPSYYGSHGAPTSSPVVQPPSSLYAVHSAPDVGMTPGPSAAQRYLEQYRAMYGSGAGATLHATAAASPPPPPQGYTASAGKGAVAQQRYSSTAAGAALIFT